MEQLEYVKQLALKNNETHRGDCPSCGGKNTFTATLTSGQYVWNCYKASCPTAGRTHKGYSIDDITNIFSRAATEDSVLDVFSIPDYFTPAFSSTEALDYVREFNCLQAYQDKRADIRYDIKRNRVVFIVQDQGRPVDGVGRALQRGVKPKWLRYSKSTTPFVVPGVKNPETKILVEDCASACAVSHVGTGVSLLGTVLLDEYIPYILLGTKKIVIALDKDAGNKSFDMQRNLSYYKDTKVWLLPDDIKYLKPEFISKKVSEL
jgi:hypothetical protein